MRVVWTDRAKARPHEIHAYIAQDQPRNADRVVDRLTRRVEQLVQSGPQASAYVLRAPTGLTWTPDPVGANTRYTVKWTAMSSATVYRLEEKVGVNWRTGG